jgi:L-ascorbate metabolism protein UlaG (beta-lactamase superfamily)
VDVYLKSDVQFEPLVNQWYAWGHLVSPATAAMITANLHLRLLDSFLRQPELHRQAVASQAMRGGMYMDHDGDLEAVRELAAATRGRMAASLRLAAALRTLNERLAQKTDATSLASLYAAVPDALKGLVELVYDLQHRPSFRLIEPLLYDSEYYDEALQSVRLTLAGEGERPFVLSSPRFAGPGVLDVAMPLRSPALDLLFGMRARPAGREQVRRAFGWETMDPERQALFDALFTTQVPDAPAACAFAGPGVRVRYFGHATVLVESASVSILVDPAIAYDGTEGAFTFADLPPRIDHVLFTHNHQDHVMLETMLQLRHKVGQVIVPRPSSGALQDPSLRLMFKALGFANVRELDELEVLEIPGGTITGVPFLGEHADLDIRSKLGYFVQVEQQGVLFLADSNALEPALYTRLQRLIGRVDALFVGLECDGAPLSWLYGPLLTSPLARSVDQSRRLNSSDSASALAIIERLKPGAVYVYAMGLEPWLGYISSIAYTETSKPMVETRALLEACRARGIPAHLLYLQHELHLAEPAQAEAA